MPFEENISASVLMLIVLLVLLLIPAAVLSLLLSALTVLAVLLILIVLLIAAAVVLPVLIIAHFISSFPYAPQCLTAAQADEAATIAIMAAKQVFIPVTIIFIKFLAITEYKLYNSITE